MADLYTQIADTSGVDRESVKRVLIAHAWSGGPPVPPKFPNSNAAVQIAEDAFRAGYRACALEGNMGDDGEAAWCAYEPSEDLKELVR